MKEQKIIREKYQAYIKEALGKKVNDCFYLCRDNMSRDYWVMLGNNKNIICIICENVSTGEFTVIL